DRGHAEHPDLLILVPQVRDLQVLRLVLEGRQPVGAEVLLAWNKLVAAVARLHAVTGGEVEVAARLLVRRQGAVERADGIRRQHPLEKEVGEGARVAGRTPR